jgi:hypothetical protein
MLGTDSDRRSFYHLLAGDSLLRGHELVAPDDVARFHDFLSMVHSLSTLVFATLAGVIASYCVRRAKPAES